jgi:hypothetical protein
MAPHPVARLRLLALCVAVAGRTALYADVTVATVTALQNNQYAAYRPGTLAAWLGLCGGPTLLLSPVIGPLVGSRFNRAVLIAGSLVALAAVFMTRSGPETPLLSILGLLSVELAFFGPAVAAGVFGLSRTARVSPVWLRMAYCSMRGETSCVPLRQPPFSLIW